MFCRFVWIFLSPPPPTPFSPSVVVVDFIGTMKPNEASEVFFPSVTLFIVVINSASMLGFCSSGEFSFFFFLLSLFSLFLNLNFQFFKPIITFSTFIPLLFLLIFSPCS